MFLPSAKRRNNSPIRRFPLSKQTQLQTKLDRLDGKRDASRIPTEPTYAEIWHISTWQSLAEMRVTTHERCRQGSPPVEPPFTAHHRHFAGRCAVRGSTTPLENGMSPPSIADRSEASISRSFTDRAGGQRGALSCLSSAHAGTSILSPPKTNQLQAALAVLLVPLASCSWRRCAFLAP
ncbi:hypothetical protein BCR34DRAFT_650488, partial [Clohesyomyces aquaticus]